MLWPAEFCFTRSFLWYIVCNNKWLYYWMKNHSILQGPWTIKHIILMQSLGSCFYLALQTDNLELDAPLWRGLWAQPCPFFLNIWHQSCAFKQWAHIDTLTWLMWIRDMYPPLQASQSFHWGNLSLKGINR